MIDDNKLKLHIIIVSIGIKFRVATAIIFYIITLHHTSSFAAAIFEPDTQPANTIAPFVLIDTDLTKGSTKAYRPWFENSAWQGDLIEYDVSSSGALSTDVIAGESPRSLPRTNWSARETFADKETADADYWDTERKIISSTDGADQIAFRWSNLTDAQKLALDPTAQVTDTQNDSLDFIRGDRSNEGNGMRTRFSILGDIIDSFPSYVGVPDANFTFTGYAAFSTTNVSRAARTYISANDGMVHVFDASDGSEVYAYIPSGLIPKLGKLTKIPYSHTYFAGGDLVAADAKVGSNWKTLLAGGFGPGLKGLFVLDITNPSLTSESSVSGADKKILFEKQAVSDDDLGFVYGRPSIVLLPGQVWHIASGNGYGSVNKNAKLFLIDLSDASYPVTKISTDNSILDNGLTAPTFLDVNSDFIADFAYAGDLKGNLWKFDLANLNSSATKLFATGTDQPITVSPDIGAHPNGGYLIYIGTGSLLSNNDLSDTNTQSIYGIWDQGNLVANTCHDILTDLGDLLCQTLTEATHTSSGTKVRVASTGTPDWTKHKGWKVDLPDSGERLLGHPQLRAQRLQFTSTNPTITNNRNWLVELDFLSGGDTGNFLFDLNQDGVLGSGDLVNTNRKPVAIELNPGNLSQPTLARISDGVDAIFINGVRLNLGAPCTGVCPGGLAVGHFDLGIDTKSNGLGGAAVKSTDAYDDTFNLTFTDYFNLEDNQVLVTDDSVVSPSGIDEDSQNLIAVIANAELSPGGILTIGNNSWNVVEYQKLIQQKLASLENGDLVSDLVDGNGNSLVFTLDGINSAKGGSGTLSIAFDNQANLSGGLIPTAADCVNADPIGNLADGHWRGGALTMHLLDVAAIQQNIEDNDAADQRVYVLQDVATEDPLFPDSIAVAGGTIQLKEDTTGDGIFDVFYGGIIANPANDGGFLYESTVFWHYSGACYGNPDWETDKNNTLLTATKISDLLTNSAQLLADITSFACASIVSGQCTDSEYVTLFNDLVSELQSLFPGFQDDITELAVFIAEGGLGDLSGGNAIVPPTDMVQSVTSPGTAGFRQGRQSWLQINLGAL